MVFESEYTPHDQDITFTDTPILDKIPPTMSTQKKMTIRFAAKDRNLEFNFKLKANISRIN